MKLIIHVEVDIPTEKSADYVASALERVFPSTSALLLEYGERDDAERTVTVGGVLVHL